MDIKEEDKYLMFFLNEEYYGIPIMKVNELIGVMDITHVPQSPDFMKGIINLRGRIIPVIDLRLKLSMKERAYDELTCIVIMQIPGHKSFIGLVVDRVAEVINIKNVDIELPPQYGQSSENNFLTGVGKVKEKIIMLLDIEAIIDCNEVISFVTENQRKEVQKV